MGGGLGRGAIKNKSRNNNKKKKKKKKKKKAPGELGTFLSPGQKQQCRRCLGWKGDGEYF
jgi:hypothetical protein